ncbi:inositol monophosphatase family protein [Aeromicrobium marinum DSM 15272]|uniref:Inositol monophosphatase family protein n=1 Tax=Aeromicrobium marinum DSM 15272 TaxID=585531 RepID=E2S9P1_9ACTN|nr:inositol monophosphatase [Aeromicrobium marinum]EFQ83965.1 inositol monophosphatase family protein [Aeromicrobium marinum DSM 15272]
MTVDDDALLAHALVTDAAALAARMRREPGLEINRKTSVSDVVTAADHAAEDLVVRRLVEAHPDDAILGEEGASHTGTTGRRWVIDPVDGTYNFASGSDYWCSALALLDGDDLVLGAVAHHGSGTVVVGGPELPTTVNGTPVDLLDAAADLSHLSAATYLHPAGVQRDEIREPFLRAAARPATIRMLGSGSMDLVGVATGRLGCWFQHTTPEWDWYPGAAIVQGAGGVARQVVAHGVTWSVAGPAEAVGELARSLEGAGS